MFERLLTPDERARLNDICSWCRVQPPDLLLYWPDNPGFAFAEVKGPREPVSEPQRESHRWIKNKLGVSVEIVRVHIVASCPVA